MKKINDTVNLYEQFLQYSYADLEELFKTAKTKEEDFYTTLSDLVMQKEQERIIGKK